MSGNIRLNERGVTVLQPANTVDATVSPAIDKSKGAVIGLIVIPTVTANLTFTVSADGVTYTAITPPTGDFTAVSSSGGRAFACEHMAFLSAYPYFKITFSASQTGGGAVIQVPMMA
jgi:hypothetical protein